MPSRHRHLRFCDVSGRVQMGPFVDAEHPRVKAGDVSGDAIGADGSIQPAPLTLRQVWSEKGARAARG